ncbi:high mobility group protein B3 [Aethina tumida]|uniref:high mobility group protein B3 n=1 Tax=Aethina tumida TaxID=116153 RepID=UPI00096B5C67|nr:high mobility group protein B3 [Aethina tumida]
MMSDESENDGVYVDNQENDIYYKKYKLLLEECANLQRSNEILVFRIQEVNKITKRRLKEVSFFKQRLMKNYSEDWSVIPRLDIVKDDEDSKTVAQMMLKEKIKEEKPDEDEKPEKPHPKSTKKTVKRTKTKQEKDPNAPKRPSNPFFQFCQDQRQTLQEQLTAELKPGEALPTKQELTRQLAIKWKSLSLPDKKIYVDMYERSKEKYAVEMSEYKQMK